MKKNGEEAGKSHANKENMILDTLYLRLHQLVLLLEWSVVNHHDGELLRPAQDAVEAVLRGLEAVRT